MKTIILMRHSVPQKCELPTEEIPLSAKGQAAARKRRREISKYGISKGFSSHYRRALETARILTPSVTVMDGLYERKIGHAQKDFWAKQYGDYTFKNDGGESLSEVSERMNGEISQILKQMEETDTVLVVSHATAICSYLLNFCQIEVVDEKQKIRKIVYGENEVLNGKINYTSYFEINYVNDKPYTIQFVD